MPDSFYTNFFLVCRNSFLGHYSFSSVNISIWSINGLICEIGDISILSFYPVKLERESSIRSKIASDQTKGKKSQGLQKYVPLWHVLNCHNRQKEFGIKTTHNYMKTLSSNQILFNINICDDINWWRRIKNETISKFNWNNWQ